VFEKNLKLRGKTMKRKMNINRRSVMKTIGALGIASTLVSGKAFGQTSSRKATALALIGDSTHDPEYIKTALDTNIVEQTLVTIDYTSDVTQLNASTLDGYRMLITCRGRIPSLTLRQQRSVRAFIQNGGSALFLNNSTDIATDTFIMRSIIGGYWIAHTEIRPYRIRMMGANTRDRFLKPNTDHPITNGVNDFELTGVQQYSECDMEIYHTVPSFVFMRSESINRKTYNNIPGHENYDQRVGNMGLGPWCPSGWAYEYSRRGGRVCVMTLGSSSEEFMNPEYIKLQKNAVLWCLRQI
jgi:type 1 glutamine amidotransferase